MSSTGKDPINSKKAPGEGIQSLRTTNAFRIVNFELYSKPNKVIMIVGGIAFVGSLAYITYMRYRYEQMGYSLAVQPDGKQTLVKKPSRWD